MTVKAKGGPLLHLLGPLIVGMSFLAVALVDCARTGLFLLTSTSTEGHVVELLRHESTITVDDQPTQEIVTFVPVFRFTSSDGKEYTVEPHSGSNPPGFRVGDLVHVLYPKGDPAGAKISSFGQLWGLPSGFGAGGVLLTGVGWVLLQWGRSRQRRDLPTTN